MDLLATLWQEAGQDRLLYTFVALLAGTAVLRAFAPADRRRRLIVAGLYAAHLALMPVAAFLAARGSSVYDDVRFALLVLLSFSMIGLVTSVVFDVGLARLRVASPRILRDLVGAGAALVAVLAIASRLGFDLSGLLATSAVLTAVLGFSLQDTLGNLMAGIALQTDSSVRVGDWIKINDPETRVNGRVVEIRWRYTAVETRNWETIIVPNSMLLKGQVTVLGRREGQPVQWRRWVWFNVDFRHAPSRVIEVVTHAIAETPIPGVASDPAPNVLLMDLADSYGRYACRYWLTDLAVDDPTDSAVRTRIFFALRRAGIPPSIPAQAVFVTEESRSRRDVKLDEERGHRLQAVTRVPLFAPLDDADREKIAAGLKHAPFTRGEPLTRQGAEAHYLYIIVTGEVSVRVAQGPLEREVACLGPGNFFGEMGLMTGAPRSATVVALTDVEAYRLDKAIFDEVLRARPQLVEKLAGILAVRRERLEDIRDDLSEEAARSRIEGRTHDILHSIRDFFGLDD